MKVDLAYNEKKKGIELIFSEKLSAEQTEYLETIGFKQAFHTPLKWYVSKHPSYKQFAEDLKIALKKGAPIESVLLTPSYKPSIANIDKSKFSLVTIYYQIDDEVIAKEFVVFDPYKNVAKQIAHQFAGNEYKEAFKQLEVFPRNYKRKARTLFKAGQYIASPKSDSKLNPKESNKPKENLVWVVFDSKGEIDSLQLTRDKAKEYINRRPAYCKNLMYFETMSMLQANELLENKKVGTLSKFDIDFRMELISEELNQISRVLKRHNLFEPNGQINQNHLEEIAKMDHNLFQDLLRKSEEWEQRISEWQNLGRIKYSVHLDSFSDVKNEEHISTNTPANLMVDETVKDSNNPVSNTKDWELTPLEYQQMRAMEKTGDAMILDAHDRHEHEKIVEQALSEEKEVPTSVLDHYPWLIPEPLIVKTQQEDKYAYIDLVVANLHEMYADGKRPTKGQIEKLAKELYVPNMGMMWEAAELSWLIWYKQIYQNGYSFNERLKSMVHFWDNLQPTFAYSDSSKELYKQYSTSCPISAIVAQYTCMDSAESIFEPSAGNGLLIIGAKTSKTHVNEIDQTRLASLRFQGFEKITSLNASQPFPDEMTKNYDVVVTNPPFSTWDDEKFDKELIIRKYFNNHVGLAKHIRMEHMMAGLALNCLKDTGKAAIIIMGHIYFGHDGFVAKYRPFFNWLFRHYLVDDVINLNSYKLYNKQGAVEKTMLILVGGRKNEPVGVAPTKREKPQFEEVADSFNGLWERVEPHVDCEIDYVIKQLEIEIAI